MTENQIAAINNAISFVSTIGEWAKLGEADFNNYVKAHTTELSNAGYPADVIEHFESVCLNIHRDVNGQG